MGIGLAVVVLAITAWLGLPGLLVGLGLHRHYEIPVMDLDGRRALVVTTSHGTLGDAGKPTGVWASEMTVLYYAFTDAGMAVDVASIEGGTIPIEPSLWAGRSRARRTGGTSETRWLDPRWSARSPSPTSTRVRTTSYFSRAAGARPTTSGSRRRSARRRARPPPATPSSAGFATARSVCFKRRPRPAPLVRGRRIATVTDKRIEELGITFTPMHPERDLRAAGAEFESATRFRDMFASHVVADGRLVTGQNQNSGAETAHRMMEVLTASPIGSH